MNKQQFNIAVAEQVMGWETKPSTMAGEVGYRYRVYIDGNEYWEWGVDFHADHNAAAMVRSRVAELEAGTQANFTMEVLAMIRRDTNLPEEITRFELWQIQQATPEQTARAAYLAVTGRGELEAVDE